MSLYQFNLLTRHEQFIYISQYGQYLAGREEGRIRIKLFYLSDFYCEIWYEAGHYTMVDIFSFKTIMGLEPYFDLIQLPLLI